MMIGIRPSAEAGSRKMNDLAASCEVSGKPELTLRRKLREIPPEGIQQAAGNVLTEFFLE